MLEILKIAREHRLIIEDCILPFLEKDRIDYSIVLLDVDPDIEGDLFYLGLSVIVNAIPIKSAARKYKTKEWYIGCTGVRVVVTTAGGKIVASTPESTINVEYINDIKRQQKITFNILPKAKLKHGNSEAELDGVGVSFEKGKEKNNQCRFDSQERTLSCLNYGHKLEWELVSPNVESVIRDFLKVQLYLYSKIRWADYPQKGDIKIIPINCHFFDEKRNFMKFGMKSLSMWYRLFIKGIKVYNIEGLEAHFELEKLQ